MLVDSLAPTPILVKAEAVSALLTLVALDYRSRVVVMSLGAAISVCVDAVGVSTLDPSDGVFMDSSSVLAAFLNACNWTGGGLSVLECGEVDSGKSTGVGGSGVVDVSEGGEQRFGKTCLLYTSPSPRD